MTITNKNLLEGDKTKRKRLKVVSACLECRRKKTKCNGEKPCVGCIKARMDCKYISNNLLKQPLPQSIQPTPNNDSSSIELIEKRLGIIENVLRSLITTNNYTLPTSDHFPITSPSHLPPSENMFRTRGKRQRHECVTTDMTLHHHGYSQQNKLAPIKIEQHRISTIKNLLNNDDEQEDIKGKYSWCSSSLES
ncbi:uncharacterized protein BX663DRAFT_523411 [Cokeromyces recurvatus]|uniref:uncharacterized protein n=1 Tax=Cokeromyces recurvatus TaxID=90255 RepID=UPI0022212AA9|nr:uncharacterized protein BX663DRAFT_523411 [Cokeromyces recurvatus]KAI7898776.1 hypothetical protein BX663DRAFT_523411 [Cokeromyces recurvatus]